MKNSQQREREKSIAEEAVRHLGGTGLDVLSDELESAMFDTLKRRGINPTTDAFRAFVTGFEYSKTAQQLDKMLKVDTNEMYKLTTLAMTYVINRRAEKLEKATSEWNQE